MAGFAPKLPLVRDKKDGYGMLKTIKAVTAQNVKMLILTSPGERMMDPFFGVGLYNYLFLQSSPSTYDDIREKINSQIAKYLPHVQITNVSFSVPLEGSSLDKNFLGVQIKYNIIPMGSSDILDINV
tara:strand:- start:2546 stop:2926 length:381 start_codon:yes stop_codon:yes gene_type:complete